MTKFYQLRQVNFEDNDLILSFDGKIYRFPLALISQRLLTATEIERKVYQVSPSGYGIRWLMIDEDLAIYGLFRLA